MNTFVASHCVFNIRWMAWNHLLGEKGAANFLIRGKELNMLTDSYYWITMSKLPFLSFFFWRGGVCGQNYFYQIWMEVWTMFTKYWGRMDRSEPLWGCKKHVELRCKIFGSLWPLISNFCLFLGGGHTKLSKDSCK